MVVYSIVGSSPLKPTAKPAAARRGETPRSFGNGSGSDPSVLPARTVRKRGAPLDDQRDRSPGSRTERYDEGLDGTGASSSRNRERGASSGIGATMGRLFRLEEFWLFIVPTRGPRRMRPSLNQFRCSDERPIGCSELWFRSQRDSRVRRWRRRRGRARVPEILVRRNGEEGPGIQANAGVEAIPTRAAVRLGQYIKVEQVPLRRGRRKHDSESEKTDLSGGELTSPQTSIIVDAIEMLIGVAESIGVLGRGRSRVQRRPRPSVAPR